MPKFENRLFEFIDYCDFPFEIILQVNIFTHAMVININKCGAAEVGRVQSYPS